MAAAFGDRLQQLGFQCHHVGLLPGGNMLLQILLDRLEHLVGSVFAQVLQFAAVMHGLQFDEIELGLPQKTGAIESRGDIRLRVRTEYRRRPESGWERRRRAGRGRIARAGILHVSFGLGPREQAHDEHHGEADQGHDQQGSHHAAEAALADQPAQAQARRQTGDRAQPAVASGLGRCSRRRGGGRLRWRRLLHVPARRSDAALCAKAPAAAKARGFGVANRDRQSEECNDNNRQ